MRELSMYSGNLRGGFHLQFEAIKSGIGSASGVATSFNVILRSTTPPDIDLSGLSGVLLDTTEVDHECVCVTIHDALMRGTPPKRVTLATGAEARLDMGLSTDGRVKTSARFVMFCWLPYIYEIEDGIGTRLLAELRDFLPIDDVAVFLDLGANDEKDGFVKHFYPHIEELGLQLSETGQFAQGHWRPASGKSKRHHEIGVVHL